MGEVAAAAALTGPGTGADMRALTDVLPGADEALPLLILDQRPYMTVRSGAAEGVDLFVSALLSMGLTLVTTIPINEPPARPRGGGLSCPLAAQHDLPPRTGRSYGAGNAASLGRGAR